MTKVLHIDSADLGRFSLAIEDGALIVAAGPDDTEIAVHDLHVMRIHCEIEVSDEGVTLSAHGSQVDQPAALRRLEAGAACRIGVTDLRLASTPEEQSATVPERGTPSPATPTPVPRRLAAATVAAQRKQLLVIDGADQKEVFALPETGSITVGNTGRGADIGLHDFYVSGIHSVLEINGDTIVVKHNEGKNGTLINGQRISEPQELRLGDVLRVGNSHLRLEIAGAPDSTPSRPSAVSERRQGAAKPRSGVIPLAAAPTSEPPQAKEPSASDGEDHLKDLEGQALGHYLLGSMLGSGHAGQVFRAQDQRTGQIVALKVLAPEFPAGAAELQQFAQALKEATPLRHANLINLFGAGKSGPRCWIAREYVDGESADRLVRRLKEESKLNWMRGLRVAVHLGSALAFLHEHKAVHGNITPKNVLISAVDKTTKLTDLMQSQALSGSRLQAGFLEQKLLSELAYLSPEQVEPDTFIDQLADLYALGAVVYTFVTGEPPFTASSPEKLIAKIRETPVIKPSRYQPKIPFPFEGVILKLLAKRQEDRYQTALELMADLDVLAHDHQIKI